MEEHHHKQRSFNRKCQELKQYKVVFIGHSNVGKTSIISRYIKNEFAMKQMNTVGVDCLSKVIQKDKIHIKLQCWDTAGQERFRSLTRNFYQGCHAIVIVFDITNYESFEALGSWLQDFETKSDKREVQKIMMANKSDLTHLRKVQTERAKSFAEQHGCHFYEVSAKDGLNIDLAFSELVDRFMDMTMNVSADEVKPKRSSMAVAPETIITVSSPVHDPRMNKSHTQRAYYQLSPKELNKKPEFNTMNSLLLKVNHPCDTKSTESKVEHSHEQEFEIQRRESIEKEATPPKRESIKLVHPRQSTIYRSNNYAQSFSEAPCYTNSKYNIMSKRKLLLLMIVKNSVIFSINLISPSIHLTFHKIL